MSESADVAAGDTALAKQYNDLRADVLSPSLGHNHDGTADGGAQVGSPLIPKVSQFVGDGSDGALTVNAPTTFEGVKNFTSLTLNDVVKPVAGKHLILIHVSGTLTINSGGALDADGFGGAGGDTVNPAQDGFASELGDVPDELEGGQTQPAPGTRGPAQQAAIADAGDDLFMAFGGGGGTTNPALSKKGGSKWAGGGASAGSADTSIGGSGGGCIVIFANAIIVNSGGRISANGVDGSSSAPTAGGSGGGGGGLVYLAYRIFTNNGIIEAVKGVGIGADPGGDGAPGLVVEKVIPG